MCVLVLYIAGSGLRKMGGQELREGIDSVYFALVDYSQISNLYYNLV